MKKVICNEKRKPEVFLNVKKVTNCKQLKKRQSKKVKGQVGRYRGEKVER